MEEAQQQPPAKIAKLSEGEEEQEKVIRFLEEGLVKHDDNRKAVQNKLHEICGGMRAQIDELEYRINKELEEKFTSEDNRFQAALNGLRENSTASTLQRAKVELLMDQSYGIIENNFSSKHDLSTLYELKTERRIISELVEAWKLANVRVAGVNRGKVFVGFTCLNPDEERVLSDDNFVNPVKYKCLLFKKWNEQESKEYFLNKDDDNDSSSFFFTQDFLGAETTYGTRVKMVVGDSESEWSDEVAEFTTPEFNECCVWKRCPDYVDEERKYNMDEKNPRIATKVGEYGYCTIIGNTSIPLNVVTSWSVNVLESENNDGGSIYIGVAPFDIDQNTDDNYDKRGWYFDCYNSALFSGPPHYYVYKEYGPRKGSGRYVHAGDSVGVVVDTIRGDLSFVLNGVNLGVAFEGIPLDKPLVPCVLLGHEGDSVELIII